ncbi:MAG: hypothetical protein RBT11_12985 [Desulfobacterales bacterium]|jgi:hypothetical protein|nr:hypothetical protein [Desulfobacterales bacterium]
MASLRNIAISLLRMAGVRYIAPALLLAQDLAKAAYASSAFRINFDGTLLTILTDLQIDLNKCINPT